MKFSINWSRPHTLISIFLLILLGAGYALVNQYYVSPAKALAEQYASVPVQEEVKLTAEQKAELEAAVPRKEQADIMADLERIASENGVNVVAVESGLSDEGSIQGYRGDLGSESYTAELSAKTLPEIDAFLAAIETNPRYMQVESIRIKNESGVRLDIGLTVFFQQ